MTSSPLPATSTTGREQIFGGIEAGGTKWVLAVGASPESLRCVKTIPTTNPDETLTRVVEFFADYPGIKAVGIGSFGPLNLDRSSPGYGTITTTPKPGWANTNLLAFLRERLEVPVAIETDVNAAALGEGRWGAARGLNTFCYLTIGTGIGGGAVVDGRLVHGLLHPEFGHMRIPHDFEADPFEGACPFHGDCLEGLASGEALRARYRGSPEDIPDPAVFALEANYLALALMNVVAVISPERIILGGGVMSEPTLLPLVRNRLLEISAGYFAAPQLGAEIDSYVVAPGLGNRSGVLGAIELARLVAEGASL